MNPIAQFQQWFEKAKTHKDIADATAMCLATASKEGLPSARMVLLKEVSDTGFVFYTNLESRKSNELKQNPHAALCFHWPALERQVRIEGKVEAVSEAEADAYFASRPRESQIGAWASQQSRPIPYTGALVGAVAEHTAKFMGRDVPRPAQWSGWRVVPDRIEFWKHAAFRLHDREVFIRKGESWDVEKLYP